MVKMFADNGRMMEHEGELETPPFSCTKHIPEALLLIQSGLKGGLPDLLPSAGSGRDPDAKGRAFAWFGSTGGQGMNQKISEMSREELVSKIEEER